MIYGLAGAMGWSPADVAEASLWQLLAAWDGYRRANGADEDAEGLTDSEFASLGDMLDKHPTVH